MRNALIVAVIAAGTLQDMRASQAYEAPWCAVTNIGHDVTWNCGMRSFEMCRQEVIAGNRGFCNPNPRGLGSWPGPGPPGRLANGSVLTRIKRSLSSRSNSSVETAAAMAPAVG
jgi:hypothetical protein